MKRLVKKIGFFVTVVMAFMLLDINGNHVRPEAATATKISTASQLSQIVNNPYGDYELIADIDVSGLELNKILLGDSACFDISFEGTLDGKGHKITGVKQGLFRSVGSKGVIKNLNVEVDFSEDIGQQYRFGLSFDNSGTIDNVNITCTSTSFIDTCMAINSSYVINNIGVIKNCNTKLIIKDADTEWDCIISGVTENNYGTITDVTAELDVSDLVSQRGAYISGICENNYAYGTVANCTTKGTMSVGEVSGINYMYLSGVAGENYGTIDNCNNYCNITAGISLSGIVDNNMGIMTSCKNYGTITSNYSLKGVSCEQGGIVARNQGVLKDCVNNGKIVVNCNKMYCGGISGVAMTAAVYDNCINNGEVSATGENKYITGGIVGEISLNTLHFEGDETIYDIGTVAFKNCVNKASCPRAWLVGTYSIACDDSQIIVNNCSNTYSGLSMYTSNEFWNVSEDRKNSIFLVCNDSDNKFKINNDTSTVYKGKQFKLDIHNPKKSKYTVAGGYSEFSPIKVKGDYISGVAYGQELVIVYTDTGAFDYILLDVAGYEKVIVNNNFTIKARAEFIDWYGIYYEEGVRLLAKDSEIISVNDLGHAYANNTGTTDVILVYTYGYYPMKCVIEVVTEEDYNYSGWKKIDGKWYYLKNGEKCRGWIESSNKWYYMNNSGVMQTGWINVSGKWYYMNSLGAMQTGWIKEGSKWYYLTKSGEMFTGWIQNGSKWYYTDSNGVMKTGWVKSSGKWYYMNSSGAMQTGWVKDGSKWYYLAKSGAMFTGWIQNGSKWYYTDSSGAMKTGWLKLSGKWYYFDKDGAMATGSRNIDGNVYYFDDDGVWVE